MDKTFANHYSQMPDTHRAASLDEYKQQIKEALHANWKILYSSFDYYAVVTTTSGAEDRYDLFNINLNAYTRYARLTPWADPSAVPHRKRTFKLAAICVASLSTHAADANRVRTAVTLPSRCRHVTVALEFVISMDELLYEALAPVRTKRILPNISAFSLKPFETYKGVDLLT